MKRKHTLLESLKRMVRLKLVVPLLRSPHPPEYKARGVAVGLAWAMTPLVGIQMWAVFMTWLIAKKVFKWSFSLPLGIAWTWVTNVFTMIPCYYIFYVTGQIMRWQVDSISGYSLLSENLKKVFLSEAGFVEQWKEFFIFIAKDFGISMLIGCIPWAIAGTFFGYYLTMRFERKRAERKKRKSYLNKTGADYEGS